MHHLTSLFLFFLCSSKSFQIPPQCTIYHPCFHFFSAVPNLFKYRHNAQFTILVYIFFCSFKSFKIPSQCTLQLHSVNLFLCSSKFPVLQFQLPSVNMHALETMLAKCFLHFPIISNTLTMYVLETLFLIFSLQFQIVTNTIRMHTLETLF